MKKTVLLAVVLVAATTAGSAKAQATGPVANPVNNAVGQVWRELAGNIGKSAEQMPEADYSFRPAPSVRTFGELIGHLADAQFFICAAALGEEPKAVEGDYEKQTGKAKLSAAFRASTEYCERAYAQADAAGSIPTKLFGAESTRYIALLTNAVHDGEHYGNIVTYLRVKGMVPPSSQPTTPPPAPPTR